MRGATPRAVTTAAPLRHQAGGAGSWTSSHPRTTTLPLGLQQNASPFCDPLRCRVCACRIGTCRLGLITVWLPVRVLPAPPRSPALTPSSPSPRNTLDFPRFGAGVMARSRSLRETKTVPEADWRPSSLASEIRFPVRGEGPGQRLGSLRQRPVCMQEIRGPSALQTDADRGLKLPPPAAYGIREGISERLQVVTPDLIGCGGRPHWSGERPFQLTDEARSIVALIDELDGPSASDRSFVWRRSRVTGSSRAIQSNSESDALRTDRIPRLTRRLLGAQRN